MLGVCVFIIELGHHQRPSESEDNVANGHQGAPNPTNDKGPANGLNSIKLRDDQFFLWLIGDFIIALTWGGRSGVLDVRDPVPEDPLASASLTCVPVNWRRNARSSVVR